MTTSCAYGMLASPCNTRSQLTKQQSRPWPGVPSRPTCLLQVVVRQIGASSSGTPTLVLCSTPSTQAPKSAPSSGTVMSARSSAAMATARISSACGSTPPWSRWQSSQAIQHVCCTWLKVLMALLWLRLALMRPSGSGRCLASPAARWRSSSHRQEARCRAV